MVLPANRLGRWTGPAAVVMVSYSTKASLLLVWSRRKLYHAAMADASHLVSLVKMVSVGGVFEGCIFNWKYFQGGVFGGMSFEGCLLRGVF
jgi:hypothetical protein